MIDLKVLKQRHRKFLKLHEAAVLQEAELAAAKTELYAKAHPRFTPRTGRTQAANKARVIRARGRLIVRAQNNMPHAAALDRGARPHRITAKPGKTLAFRGRDGKMVFRKSVMHPGNKPYRFLRNATLVGGKVFGQSMARKMRQLAKGF